MLVIPITCFSCNTLECVSINDEECKTRPKIINVNSNKPLFYPYNIRVNKCSGSCNSINDPYAKLCVPDVVKNLISRTHETKHAKWHETCKCKCRLDASDCNNKQHWSKDKCRCECNELIDKGRSNKGFIWNPSNCEWECDKLCDIGQYLDYKHFKCRKKVTDKLVEECSKNTDGNEIIYIMCNIHSFACYCVFINHRSQ